MEKIQRQQLEKVKVQVNTWELKVRRLIDDVRDRDRHIQTLYDKMENTPIGKIIRRCRENEAQLKNLKQQHQQLELVVEDVRKSHVRVKAQDPQHILLEKEDELKRILLATQKAHMEIQSVLGAKESEANVCKNNLDFEKRNNIEIVSRFRGLEAVIHNISQEIQKNNHLLPIAERKDAELDEIRHAISNNQQAMGVEILQHKEASEHLVSLKTDLEAYRSKFRLLKKANHILLKKIVLWEDNYESEDSEDEWKDDHCTIKTTLDDRVEQLKNVFLNTGAYDIWKPPKYRAAYDFGVFQHQTNQPSQQ